MNEDFYGMPKDWPFRQKKQVMDPDPFVHKTMVGRYEISTCQLNIFKAMGEGLVLETMIFNNETGDTDVMPHFTRRHDSVEEAERWHSEVVGKIQAEVDAYEIVKRATTKGSRA